MRGGQRFKSYVEPHVNRNRFERNLVCISPIAPILYPYAYRNMKKFIFLSSRLKHIIVRTFFFPCYVVELGNLYFAQPCFQVSDHISGHA